MLRLIAEAVLYLSVPSTITGPFIVKLLSMARVFNNGTDTIVLMPKAIVPPLPPIV
jgi:hypothetical protein